MLHGDLRAHGALSPYDGEFHGALLDGQLHGAPLSGQLHGAPLFG